MRARQQFGTTVLGLAALALLGNAPQARAGEILVNPGFETGSLSPWFQDRNFGGSVNWMVTNSDSHSGTFSATNNGNLELRQNFAGVPAALITDVSFWARHPDPTVGPLAFDFFYSDGTDDEFLVNTSGSGWNFFDVTSNLDTTKTLTGFSVFGNSDGVTFVDDLNILTSLPEPSCLALLGLGLGGLAAWRRWRK
jgi:hypothetical protein